jgi:hypothetical protein
MTQIKPAIEDSGNSWNIAPESALAIVTGALSLGFLRRLSKNGASDSKKAALIRSTSMPVNMLDQGPLGMGFVPAAREKIKSTFLAAYLSRMYVAELNSFGNSPVANSAVAHAAEDEKNSTMNVAMPEFSAEYWCTFIPAGQAPIFRVTFPEWAVFSSLTAYNTQGLPVVALNHRQAPFDPRAHIVGSKGNANLKEVDTALNGNGATWTVNLMFEAPDWSGPLCVLFRVYRPPTVQLCPPCDRPACRLVPTSHVSSEQDWLNGCARRERVNQPPTIMSAFFDFGDEDGGVGYQPAGFWDDDSDEVEARPGRSTRASSASYSPWLPQAPTEAAFDAGRRLGTDFQGAIQGKIKSLGDEKFGSQFFHPSSVAGLFVNQSATYVVAFLPLRLPNASVVACLSTGNLPPDEAKCHGMKLQFQVPSQSPWRPFFGAMTVSYETTATTAALDATQLGGWGQEVLLFAAHTAADATRFGGYDPTQAHHRLLTWRSCGTPGLVLRFLHHCDGPHEGLTMADADAAAEERQKLAAMDGTRTTLRESSVPGVAQIEYF